MIAAADKRPAGHLGESHAPRHVPEIHRTLPAADSAPPGDSAAGPAADTGPASETRNRGPAGPPARPAVRVRVSPRPSISPLLVLICGLRCLTRRQQVQRPAVIGPGPTHLAIQPRDGFRVVIEDFGGRGDHANRWPRHCPGSRASALPRRAPVAPRTAGNALGQNAQHRRRAGRPA